MPWGWKNRHFKDCKAVKLQVPVFKNGKFVGQKKGVQELQKYVETQLLDEIWKEEQRFDNPHKHYLDMSPKYYEMKMDLLHQNQ